MNKISSVLFLFSFLTLYAKEPTLGILKSIPSNANQIFTISNTNYTCDAYGVVGIKKLMQNKNLPEVCIERIAKLYKVDPKKKYFSQGKLKVLQMYHLEFIEQKCLLFARGELTLSEMLLREGIALVEANFQDREYEYVFNNAQENAKFHKRGLWSSKLTRECVEALYK